MKKIVILLLLIQGVLGCASVTKNKYAIVTTNSGIGFSVGIKDTNQTPEVRLGYIRNETVFIPINGDTVASVFARLNYRTIWTQGGGIGSEISTGQAAINRSTLAEPTTAAKGQ